MRYAYCESPVGPLLLAGRRAALELLAFPCGNQAKAPEAEWEARDAPFAMAARQLAEYFNGRRRTFELPLAPQATAFQRKVLEALQAIPYGETRTYKDIAAVIGRPKAVRAVGAANANNPIPIIIPCHRVVGSDGSLTGFGGGLDAKRKLLRLEAETAAA